MNYFKRSLKIVLYSSMYLLFSVNMNAQKAKSEKSLIKSSTFSAFKFRNIGPAYASGRIVDIEVNPKNHNQFYVAAGAGNVWKTDNAGITFYPIFDHYGSYSIADVAVDPNNTNIVWVGTGEYNSQRAIGYGDGIYVSEDGGQSFKNVGLKTSEHIGRIIIDPRNSDVYVAAQGPLWGPGGERGIFKTSDMGQTWDTLLTVSKNTGFNDIVFDPENPDILYASSYERRRRVYTLIDGGPESAIYKSADAGKTWKKLSSGLPKGNVGRIGLAISPVNPDYVYAIIEGTNGSGGFFRTTNQGASWKKMNSYVSTSPQYYNRIYCDPKDADKVYSADTYTKYTFDGGKTWKTLGLSEKHVDDHALWIDPDHTKHLLIGCDGGLYETFDMGANWRHAPNLPITQFYRVAVDNAKPFYNVAGGTQDNNSTVGPSQTICRNGILQGDWKVTQGGDGFFSAIDYKEPNIVYAESQYGGLVRYDKKSGERVYIQPLPPKDVAYRWNWNAPLEISSFDNKRLYFAANKLFRSDDRGNSWKVISPDLTRHLNRNEMKILGKIQPVDAVAKNASTSIFGNITAFAESPINENLLYVGTDDGLIQITEDGGKTWRKLSKFRDVPEMTYVSCIFASQHNENIVYAAFDGRKDNNLKPYILKSQDKGKTWYEIVTNLPEKGTVYSLTEDPIEKQLLFAGTEFGLYYSNNGGGKWIKLSSGLPTIAVRDMKIQKREDDLVIATFGRGFYILDDFSLLRKINDKTLKKDNILFPVKDAFIYSQTSKKYGQGATVFAGKNPEYGATFTYYIKDKIKTKKDYRLEAEAKAKKNGAEISFPSFDILREEADEIPPYLMFTVKNESGEVVRRIKRSAQPGLQRFNWGLRRFNMYPVTDGNSPMHNKQTGGIPVPPGKYTVSMAKIVNGIETKIGEEQSFSLKLLGNLSLPAKNPVALENFKKDAAEVYGITTGLTKWNEEMNKNVKALRTALINGAGSTQEDLMRADDMISALRDMHTILNGDKIIDKLHESQPPNLNWRISAVTYGAYHGSDATQTLKDNLQIVKDGVTELIKQAKDMEQKLQLLEIRANKAGSPWSPGRIPDFK
ncbi:MAG: glycosyl hydrolase [Chlorobi bacterium]|nr:glycosyl hydrolase [Chlorobiota bacterium]